MLFLSLGVPSSRFDRETLHDQSIGCACELGVLVGIFALWCNSPPPFPFLILLQKTQRAHW